MSDERKHKWEIRVLIATFVTSIVAVVVAVFTPVAPWAKDLFFGTNEMKRVVAALDTSLGLAETGRQRMAAVNVEVNHCRTRPSEAANQVKSLVTANRKAVLKEVSDLGSPGDSGAQTLIDEFNNAMSRSYSTDRAYADWLRSWDSLYADLKAQGCAGIPHDGNAWSVFEDNQKAAQDAKKVFIEDYNEAAKKYDGVRHDWATTDF